MTLLLSRPQVAALMRPWDYLAAVEAGLRAGEEERAAAPPPLTLGAEGGAFHAKAALVREDRSYAALKLNANFPDNRSGLPTVQGAILLCDGENGALLAVLDSIEITLRRTAAASALAARLLARADAATLLVCGCGAQGAAHVEALGEVLKLRRCFAWDRDRAKAEQFAEARRREGLDALAIDEIGAAAAASGVIVTCTTAREPFLSAKEVQRGTFVAAVGADSPDKSEVRPELMASARVVVDSLSQCLDMGDLRHAVRSGAMRADEVHASLGALLAGSAPGRTSDDQIFIFDSTGTALQDVAAAAAVYERARQRGGYAEFDFRGGA